MANTVAQNEIPSYSHALTTAKYKALPSHRVAGARSVVMQKKLTLPETGFVRLPEILSVIPISATTWWEGVRTGRYPKGVKLSARCTAWRAEDIRALIDNIGQAA